MSGLTHPTSPGSQVTPSILGSGSGTDVASAAKNAVVNPLHKFASYNYILTFAALTPAQVKSNSLLNPGELTNIISKTGGDWGNGGKRVNTGFGKFDYFIEDLVIKTIYGFDGRKGNSFATDINFKIVEPYSMGLLIAAMQASALASGYKNFQEAPYVIAIEFKGWDDQGNPVSDSQSTRVIPIKILDIVFTVTQAGAVYEITAIPYQEIAFTDIHAITFKDVQISGDTVQDLFKSLENFLKINLAATKEQLQMDAIDEYFIETPSDFTIPPGSNMGPIWTARVFEDHTDAGQKPMPDVSVVYDKDKKIYLSSKIPVTIVDKTFHFKQNSKIQDIINEIVVRSDYITKQIENNQFKVDANGMINWWRIETFVEDLKHNEKLNRPNRRFTYRAVPYKVHVSRLLPPGVKSPNTAGLVGNVTKVYNYIYTGKNTDLLNFNIEYKFAFITNLPSDLTNNIRTENLGSSATAGKIDPALTAYESSGTATESTEPMRTSTFQSKEPLADNGRGGSGSDSFKTAQVKTMKKILENPDEMMDITVEVMGDPYYIPYSGMGNQIGTPSSFNLMTDGSLNYQSGETDIIIIFKTPIDINLETGLYNFDKTIDTFTGLYHVQSGECRFVQGKYTNTLQAVRRVLQQSPGSFSSTPSTPIVTQGEKQPTGYPRGSERF